MSEMTAFAGVPGIPQTLNPSQVLLVPYNGAFYLCVGRGSGKVSKLWITAESVALLPAEVAKHVAPVTTTKRAPRKPAASAASAK